MQRTKKTVTAERLLAVLPHGSLSTTDCCWLSYVVWGAIELYPPSLPALWCWSEENSVKKAKTTCTNRPGQLVPGGSWK